MELVLINNESGSGGGSVGRNRRWSRTLLPDGTFLLGSVDSANVAKLDPSTLTWTAMTPRQGVGTSDEDSWVLMPDNTVVAPSCQNPPTTWAYDVSTDIWHQDNPLPLSIVDVKDETGPCIAEI